MQSNSTKKQNQYMLFAGNMWYPAGGVEDWKATFYADNDKEAEHRALAFAAGEYKDYQWFQLIAIAKGSIRGYEIIKQWDQIADWEGSFTDPKPEILERFDHALQNVVKKAES